MTDRHQYIAILCGWLLLLVSACNSDVFIDGKELPDYSEFTIDGDGGYMSTAFSRDGLTAIRFEDSVAMAEYLTYYDTKGHRTDAFCPVSELGSIGYDTPVQYYTIGFTGEMLYVSSLYNATGFKKSITLFLEYDYGVTKKIHITIIQGKTLTCSSWYDGELIIDEDFEQITHRTGFVNNSHIAQRMEVMPYISSDCSDFVVPEQNWAKGLIVDMPLLTYNGNGWMLKDCKDIRLDEWRTFSPFEYSMEKIIVEVPADTKCTVTYTLHYTKATQTGKLFFYNQACDFGSESGFTCTAIYPTNYEYAVSYE